MPTTLYNQYIYKDGQWRLIGTSTDISYEDLIQILGFDPQKTIVAGEGITIDRGSEYDTISATGDSYTSGNGINIQNNEIAIEDGVIFNCGTSTTVI